MIKKLLKTITLATTKEKACLFTLLVVLFLSRILYIIIASPIQLSGDAVAYNQSAIDLLNGKKYMWDGWYSEVPPFYSIFVTFIYCLFGYNQTAVYVIQSMFDVITGLFIFLIAKKEFKNAKAGFLAIMLMLIYPTMYKGVGFLGSYNLFTVEMVCVVFLFLRAIREERLIFFLLTGLLLGVASLTRSTSILLWVVMIGYAIFIWRKKTDIKKTLYLAALTSTMIITLTPWAIWNYKMHGKALVTATSGGYALWLASAEKSDWSYSDLPNASKFTTYKEEYKKTPEAQASDIFFKKALINLKTRPKDYIFTVITNFGRLYFNFPYTKIPSRATIVFMTLNIILLMLALLSAFVDWRKSLFIGLYIVYFTGIHMFLHISWFWHNLQTVPFILLLASLKITNIIAAKKSN